MHAAQNAQWMLNPHARMYAMPAADMSMMPGFQRNGNVMVSQAPGMFLPANQLYQALQPAPPMQYLQQVQPEPMPQQQAPPQSAAPATSAHTHAPPAPTGTVSIHQYGDHAVMRGPDGATVPVPARVRVKDPAVRGNVLYDLPSHKIEPTLGMWEYLEGQHKGGSHRAQCHRATLCKLFLEDRCGQGTKCKSFHIEKSLISMLRQEHNVEFDHSFLTEVAVITLDGCVSAVRYKNIIRSKGLDAYKASLPGKLPVPPAKVCPHYAATMTCPDERNCDFIHIKPTDLKDSVRRTPCCYNHGDASTESALCVHDAVDVKGKATGGTWKLQMSHVALTNGGAKRLTSGTLGIHDICVMHVKSRCKFGRGCDRVHVCRQWATEVGLSALLNTRMSAGRSFLQTNSLGMGMGMGMGPQNVCSLSPGSTCGTARSHPPSPSGYSLYSVSSETELGQQNPSRVLGFGAGMVHPGLQQSSSSAGLSASGALSQMSSSMNFSVANTSMVTGSTASSPEPDDEQPPLTTTNSAASMKRLQAFPCFGRAASEASDSDDEPGFDLLDDPTESLLTLMNEN